jgi:Ni,Fe-hydrogenase maturation factor
MNRTLIVSIGNPLRSDDGLAHRVVVVLGADSRRVHQLTPEVAADLAGYDRVVFLDAAVDSALPRIDPVPPPSDLLPLGHIGSPSDVVALARGLYGFEGKAFIARLPASDFSFRVPASE